MRIQLNKLALILDVSGHGLVYWDERQSESIIALNEKKKIWTEFVSSENITKLAFSLFPVLSETAFKAFLIREESRLWKEWVKQS